MANTGKYEVSMTKMEMVCFGPHRIYPYCVGIGCILDSRTSANGIVHCFIMFHVIPNHLHVNHFIWYLSFPCGMSSY